MTSFNHPDNFTNMTSQQGYQDWWMAAAILSKFFIVIEGYLLLTLAMFELRVGMKNKRGQQTGVLAPIKTDPVADLMRRLCLLASFLILLRSITELIEIHEGQHSDLYCNSTRYTKTVLQCGAFTCLYFVLWLRQRQFYKIPAFEYLYGRATRFFSGAVVFLMAAANVITITLFLATRRYQSSERGCVIQWSTIWVKIPRLLLFIFTTTFQIILMSLLLHPLIKHGGSSSSRKKQRKQVTRVSIAALVAICTTITVSLVSLVYSDRMYGAVQQLISNLDILVTFLSILFSFLDWKSRLFSMFVNNKRILSTVKIYKSPTSGGVTSESRAAMEGPN